MADLSIYKDIALRTDGSIFIGVVGPVRTGKSTFIKKFMDLMVIPNIKADYMKERANDELPQSAAGRTIMTTEPKFVPETAVEINVDNEAKMNVRLIDCVGYIVPSAYGYIEEDGPRMVMTPWYDEPVPFNMAAEVGTQKVITDHSTIGLVVTTDGSISDIPREEYEEAEEKVIAELKKINKPFVVLLNSVEPSSEETLELTSQLSEKYSVPVIPVNCLNLDEKGMKAILAELLYEFPLREIRLNFPRWFDVLERDHEIKRKILETAEEILPSVQKISDASEFRYAINECEPVETAVVERIELGTGTVIINAELNNELYYKILTEQTGVEISDDEELMKELIELAKIRKKYLKVKDALDSVDATGYGIVMPDIDELSLEEPEIMKQGGRYGVRLRASAPSIHLMKANITTEVSPIVGSEKQSEDLVMYLLKEFENDPTKIWDSNIFGKSLHELVNEGLHTKLSRMPDDARMRLKETLERVINEGCSGLICIIL